MEHIATLENGSPLFLPPAPKAEPHYWGKSIFLAVAKCCVGCGGRAPDGLPALTQPRARRPGCEVLESMTQRGLQLPGPVPGAGVRLPCTELSCQEQHVCTGRERRRGPRAGSGYRAGAPAAQRPGAGGRHRPRGGEGEAGGKSPEGPGGRRRGAGRPSEGPRAGLEGGERPLTSVRTLGISEFTPKLICTESCQNSCSHGEGGTPGA